MDMYMPGYNNIVNTLADCEAVCEHMTTIMKNKPDIQSRRKQLKLLRDCADVCGLTGNYIARRSPFGKNMAELCSCICDYCAKECLQFPDPESQSCARTCINCARECRAFAMMR